ncbi:MAG: energy transducer TonB [Leptospiraceae bacterium]|nr:energy transducer TonB [Leptospiraceae bacterium]MDW8307022.1 energy transducer TonB [Leptospiraceae bacterium]
MTITCDKGLPDGIVLNDGRVVFPGLHNSFAEEKLKPFWQRHLFLLCLVLSSFMLSLLAVRLRWEASPEDVFFSTQIFDFGDIRFRSRPRTVELIEIDEVFGNQYVKKDEKKVYDPEEIAKLQSQDAEAIGEGEGIGEAEDLAFLGPGVRPPRLISPLKEYYPPEARSLGVNAELYLEIIIDRDGVVRQVTSYPDSVRLDRSLAPAVEDRLKKEFQAAARRTLLGARYTPVIKDGNPIVVRMGIPFQFRISS